MKKNLISKSGIFNPRALVAFSLCILVRVSASSALASEPAWWTQQKRDCGLSPSLDYETWRAQGMPCNRGSRSGPSQAQQAAASFDKDIEGYSNLVDRIAQGIPNPKMFEDDFGTMPKSSGDLSERLIRLNDFLDSLSEYRASQVDDAIEEREHARTISGEVAKLEKATAALQHENEIMLESVRSFQKGTETVLSDIYDRQADALIWFLYVTPKDSVKYYTDTVGDRTTGLVPRTAIPPREVFNSRVHLKEKSPNHTPVAELVISSHSNTEKITNVNNSYRQFLRLEGQIKEVESEYDQKWFSDMHSKLLTLEDLRDKSIFDAKYLVRQVKAAHENFVVGAVESFVWKTYVTHVSIEEAKKFYGLNKNWYDLGKASQMTADVRRNVNAGKSALDILGSKAEGMKDFLDVEKRTLDLMVNVNRFLSEAPNIAAMATPEETRSFLNELDKERGDFAMSVMQEYTGLATMAPSSPMAQALRKVTVRTAFQNIAKKLGLAEHFED